MTAERLFDLVIPRGFKTLTGGFIYDQRIVEQLRDAGWRIDVHELDPQFPHPSAAALRRAAAVLSGIPDGRQVVIDGLALGGMPGIVEQESTRLRLIALIHHPLALETGLAQEVAAALYTAERRALSAVDGIIVTSRTTARALSDYDVPAGLVMVVPPGTDMAPLAEGSGRGTFELACVGTLTPRKGHAVLLEALAGLLDRDWHLCCVGSADRDSRTAAAVRKQIAKSGLTDRVTLRGELAGDALDAVYAGADAFVLASYYEGYGMVFAEALARGLPIVATAGGAVAETVPASAGLLVKPGDSTGLRMALARLLDEPGLRGRLRAGARKARNNLPTWRETGHRFALALARSSAG